ncbi:MAG: lysylphosphatidylglycerol synthase transmembrane domain-containing protein [Spirochaetota bacterium]
MEVPSRLLKLLVFIVLSSVSLFLVLHFTVNEQTKEAVRGLKANYLLLLCLVWLLILTMDALAILFLTKGTDENLKTFSSYKIATLRIFFNVITPFSFGGQPMMIYTLKKEGVSAGKGSSIVVTKLMLNTITTLFGATIAFIFFRDKITETPAIDAILFIGGILGVTVIVVIIAGLLSPYFIIKLVTDFGKLLHKLKFIKIQRHFRSKVIHEAWFARRSFKRYFGRHFLFFLAATVCCVLWYFLQLLLLWLILTTLGVKSNFAEGMAVSALLLFIISFLPTPGAAGLGEAIFVIIYAGLVPKFLLGISVVLWRIFYQYISSLLGALSSAKYLSDLVIKEK